MDQCESLTLHLNGKALCLPCWLRLVLGKSHGSVYLRLVITKLCLQSERGQKHGALQVTPHPLLQDVFPQLQVVLVFGHHVSGLKEMNKDGNYYYRPHRGPLHQVSACRSES